MAAAKKNARLKKHRGVTLIAPSAGSRTVSWQARWKDPDSGKIVKRKLPDRLTTPEARAEWAAAKLEEIKRRKMALEGGAVRAQGVTLRDAIQLFFDSRSRSAKRTIKLYKEATAKFLKWADGPGKVTSCDELTRGKLMAFTTWLFTMPKSIAAAGEPPGTRRDTDEQLATSTANQNLIKVGTVLRYVVNADLCPRLVHDDVRRALVTVEEHDDPPRHLSRAECRALLDAALRHDESGKHRREIAGFVLFLIMTGMRADEGRLTEWSMVATEEPWEVKLPARIVKTRRARDVGLDVSPNVHELLTKMRPEKAEGSVFCLNEQATRYAMERLIEKYNAPDCTWQVLRSTCGTYLTCAPSIFGAASAYLSANRLGHSVEVAQESYLGRARGIPHEAKTLEAAMGVEDLAARIVARAKPIVPRTKRVAKPKTVKRLEAAIYTQDRV